MKKIITLSVILFFALLGNTAFAQSSNCQCWQPRDPSWQLVPFATSPPADFYRNDDDFTNAITLPFHFCFWGQSVNTVYISNNGYINFPTAAAILSANSSYEPQPFPIAGPNIICPYWSDVETSGANAASEATNTVWYKITPHYLIVQWDSVGYYKVHIDKLNTFQVIISDGTDPIIADGNTIEFCYKDMLWAEGDDTHATNGFNGSNPGMVGINDADGIHYIQFGGFDQPGTAYFGSSNAAAFNNGVSWLDYKEFIMNSCTGEAPPVESGTTYCDTFRVCPNDTLKLPANFWTPFSGKVVHSQLQAPAPAGTSIIYNVPGQKDTLVIQVVANLLGTGTHTINFFGYDNEIPSDTMRSSFVVIVGAAPPHITLTASPDTLCPGNTSVINAHGGNSYQWSTGANGSFIAVSPATTQTYSVKVSTGCGTLDTSIQVVVTPTPTVTITPQIAWTCPGDSIQLTASGASTYVWNPNATLSCTNCVNPYASPTFTFFPTSYQVTGTSQYGCTATASVLVHVHNGPTVTASTSQDSLCYGHSATLNAIATGGGITFSWAPIAGLSCSNCQSPTATPTSTVTYTVTVTDSSGCTKSDTVHIYVTPGQPLGIIGKTSLCYGDSETLTATGGGNFTWQPGGSTGGTLAIKPTVTTKYKVSITVANCGTQTDSLTVYVNPKPAAAFTTNPPDSGCAPLCVQFNDQSTITSGNIARWKWEYGNGDTLGTYGNPSVPHCYNNAGSFNVALVITSDSGCKDSVQKNNLINVFSHPAGNFTSSPQPTTIMAPTITFGNNVNDAYGMPNWHWDFGERGDSATDTVSILQNPMHTYKDTGTFCVQLIAENRHGCMDTVTNCLVIQSQFVIYIPSAFSPNGDNKNDIFLPEGNFVSLELYVYDRWGKLVYHTTDKALGWNGKVNGTGAVCQEDTYVYKINATDSKGAGHTYTGQVNLLR